MGLKGNLFKPTLIIINMSNKGIFFVDADYRRTSFGVWGVSYIFNQEFMSRYAFIVY